MSCAQIRGLLAALCADCWIFAGLFLASHASAQPTQPNVVLIVSDDSGYADLGFQNQFTGKTTPFVTPNLDALAQQSVLFSNGYVSASLCAPSRAGLLTGRYQQKFGFEHNLQTANNSPINGMPLSETLISQKFKAMGYSTGIFGKWHQGESVPQQPQNRGFDEFFGILGGSRAYFEDPDPPAILRNGVEVAWQSEPSFNEIPNDAINGRLFTDAIGDETSKFIANHANAGAPFFAYVPFTAPHYPNNRIKGSDYAQFNLSTTLNLNAKVSAALTYGMDRNIGEIISRLNDPNRDGNTSDSIRNNTIVIYVNDNGGSLPLENGAAYDNGVLKDWKGSEWEGGIRVPFMISAPGAMPRVANDMVSTLDLFPTLVAAAGGQQTTPTDGVNLMPYLTGQQTGPVHEALFWRMGVDGWAVRKGNWKLARGHIFTNIELYNLAPDGTGETVDLSAQNPAKFQELLRDYVAWEVTVDKLRWSTQFTVSRFDEFVMRNDLTTNFNWLWPEGWRDNQNLSVTAKLQCYDAAPNTVLIFETRDDASYQTRNLLQRASSLSEVWSPDPTDFAPRPTPNGLREFTLNEVRLRGNFGSETNQSATMDGEPLMFVNNLSGRQPRLALDANKSTSATFTFNVNLDLVLYHDTLITGDGTGNFNVGGVIRDFYDPRSVIKEGTSRVALSGHNTYRGSTIVRGGEIVLASSNAAIDGNQQVTIESAGRLTMSAGLIKTNALTIQSGGTFTFTGGNLQTNAVTGDLQNAGGKFDAGVTPGLVSIQGNYTQSAGTLALDGSLVSGVAVLDHLSVTGAVQLAGVLDFEILDPIAVMVGSSLPIITATGGVSGQFSQLLTPTLPTGLTWQIDYGANSVNLNIVELPGSGGSVGFLTRLKQSFGIDPGGDWDLDGDTDGNDLMILQRQSWGGGLRPVPEPAGVVMLLASLFAFAAARQGKSKRCSLIQALQRPPQDAS